jgi:hypothetical protein
MRLLLPLLPLLPLASARSRRWQTRPEGEQDGLLH